MLWSLLKFVQGIIKDYGANIAFTFNGFPTPSDYWYNGLSYDDAARIDLNTYAEDESVRKHHAILTSLHQSGSFKLNILLQNALKY